MHERTCLIPKLNLKLLERPDVKTILIQRCFNAVCQVVYIYCSELQSVDRDRSTPILRRVDNCLEMFICALTNIGSHSNVKDLRSDGTRSLSVYK